MHMQKCKSVYQSKDISRVCNIDALFVQWIGILRLSSVRIQQNNLKMIGENFLDVQFVPALSKQSMPLERPRYVMHSVACDARSTRSCSVRGQRLGSRGPFRGRHSVWIVGVMRMLSVACQKAGRPMGRRRVARSRIWGDLASGHCGS